MNAAAERKWEPKFFKAVRREHAQTATTEEASER